MSLQDVIGDVLLAGTLIAAVWLGWLTRDLVKQSIADVREAREARYDQQRPVLLPSNGDSPLDVKFDPTGVIYPDLRAPKVNLVITNIGTGPALAVLGVLYGPAPKGPNEVRYWRSFWSPSPIGSGDHQDAITIIYGLDVPGDAVIGRDKKYTIYAPPLPDPSRPSDYGSSYIVARLTITYHDIFGRKHASIFNYTRYQQWVYVDEGFFSGIPQDLEELEREHGRSVSPPAYLPEPPRPSPIPRRPQIPQQSQVPPQAQV